MGYSIRFDDKSDPKSTKLLYMTDGMLLREFLIDPMLRRFGYVIIDEAHERTLSTDILLGLLKALLRKRPKSDFKLVIMTAALEMAKFRHYFKGCDCL